MRQRLLFVFALLSASASLAFAQGSQTGVLTGTVKSSDGQTLAGVTVTVKSPALQGTRTALSDANGAYIFKGLHPGPYTVSFELVGMGSVEHNATVPVGGSMSVDAALKVASVQESITVTAETPTILATTTGGQTFKGEQIDTLPTSRTLEGITALAPGLTENTPNSGQVTISGSFAYDNVFLIDGVDVNDNLFGSPNNVFIEDAIEETQVLTSGISAEYGRFSGGVINALTKRGGNEFSGSFRTDFENPKWTKQTPYEIENKIDRKSKLNKFYQETLGGPIVKDRLWFFLAARQASNQTQGTFDFTKRAHTDIDKNKRYEGKLTGTLSPNHTLQASYVSNKTTNTSPTFDFSIAPSTINTLETPNRLFGVNYNGVLKSNLFAEAQYSQQKFEFASGGGTSTNPFDSPIFTFGATAPGGQHYNGPYFSLTGDPETRKNRQLTAALSYFLSTKSLGRHDLKGGFENFRTTRIGGNSQSSTGFVYYADYKTDANGDPVTDAAGNLTPVFEPFQGLIINWLATIGARLDITTNSFYVNDRWTLNDHWAFNLGARYEKVRSQATGGIVGVDTNTLVPRLAAAFDVRGDGKFKLDATYAHYAGKYNEAQIGNNTRVGNPSYVYGLYVGPSGEGQFAPGFDPRNYVFLGAGVPDGNVSFNKGLSSPITKEYTLGFGVDLGKGGYAKAIYTHRKVTNFIEDFIQIENGSIDVPISSPCDGCNGTITLDKRIFHNSDVPTRSYSGLQLQAGYRLMSQWHLEGHWTHEFKYDGNFEGENTNQPAITSTIGNYPEILVASRNFPSGRLNGFQKDKVRAWTTYDLKLGRAGNLSASVLYRYDSPTTDSIVARSVPLSSVQGSRDPGYATLPGFQTLFFGNRGAQFFNASHLFDTAITYNIKTYKKLSPYVKFDLRNAFNKQPLIAFNTTVTANNNGPVDANGLPTDFVKSKSFGKHTSNTSYPTARTIRLAVGLRF